MRGVNASVSMRDVKGSVSKRGVKASVSKRDVKASREKKTKMTPRGFKPNDVEALVEAAAMMDDIEALLEATAMMDRTVDVSTDVVDTRINCIKGINNRKSEEEKAENIIKTSHTMMDRTDVVPTDDESTETSNPISEPINVLMNLIRRLILAAREILSPTTFSDSDRFNTGNAMELDRNNDTSPLDMAEKARKEALKSSEVVDESEGGPIQTLRQLIDPLNVYELKNVIELFLQNVRESDETSTKDIPAFLLTSMIDKVHSHRDLYPHDTYLNEDSIVSMLEKMIVKYNLCSRDNILKKSIRNFLEWLMTKPQPNPSSSGAAGEGLVDSGVGAGNQWTPIPHYPPGISEATAVPGPHTPAEPEFGPNGEVPSSAFVNLKAGIDENLSNQLHEFCKQYSILKDDSCFHAHWGKKYRGVKNYDINFLSDFNLNDVQKGHFYKTVKNLGYKSKGVRARVHGSAYSLYVAQGAR